MAIAQTITMRRMMGDRSEKVNQTKKDKKRDREHKHINFDYKIT